MSIELTSMTQQTKQILRALKIFGFGALFAIAGMALYVFVLQPMCWEPAFYCGVYNVFAKLVEIYGNFMMSFVRPECVGGGPDDCLAQGLAIMLCTLLVIGWLVGWVLVRRGNVKRSAPRSGSAVR